MRLTALSVCLLMTAGSCLGASGSPPREREELLLGVIAHLDSPASEPVVRGSALAVSRYNADPDRTYDIRLRRFNTKGEQGAADAATRAAATERLIGMIGPFGTSEAQIAGPVLAGAALATIAPTLDSSTIPGPGWGAFRRLVASDKQQAGLLTVEVARRAKGAIAILFSQGAEAVAEHAKAEADRAKLPVARLEGFGPKADLKALAASVMAVPPAGIVFVGDPARSKPAVEAMRAAGFKGALGAQRMKDLSEPPPEVLTVTGYCDPTYGSLTDLRQGYRDRYDADMPPFAAEAFEAAVMLLEAAEEVEPKAAEISEFLRLNREFLGDTKSYLFDETGEMVNPPVWVHVFKGRWLLSGVFDPGKRLVSNDG